MLLIFTFLFQIPFSHAQSDLEKIRKDLLDLHFNIEEAKGEKSAGVVLLFVSAGTTAYTTHKARQGYKGVLQDFNLLRELRFAEYYQLNKSGRLWVLKGENFLALIKGSLSFTKDTAFRSVKSVFTKNGLLLAITAPLALASSVFFLGDGVAVVSSSYEISDLQKELLVVERKYCETKKQIDDKMSSEDAKSFCSESANVVKTLLQGSLPAERQ